MPALLALLAGIGCGYSSYYPRPITAEDLDRYDTGPADSSSGVPCPALTGIAIDLHVTNAGSDTVTITKMELSCVEQYIADLAPGADHTEPSEEGAVFLFRDSSGATVDVLQLPGDWNPYELTLP